MRFILCIYKPRGNPTRFAPRPKPAPWRAVTPIDGETKSRTAKTAAATSANVAISSTGRVFRGIKSAAPATTRPSIRYLIARLITSATSMFVLYLGKRNFAAESKDKGFTSVKKNGS